MTLTMQIVVLWVTTLQTGEHNASAKWELLVDLTK